MSDEKPADEIAGVTDRFTSGLVIPFGEFSGKRLAEVPPASLKAHLEAGDFDAYPTSKQVVEELLTAKEPAKVADEKKIEPKPDAKKDETKK